MPFIFPGRQWLAAGPCQQAACAGTLALLLLSRGTSSAPGFLHVLHAQQQCLLQGWKDARVNTRKVPTQEPGTPYVSVHSDHSANEA